MDRSSHANSSRDSPIDVTSLFIRERQVGQEPGSTPFQCLAIFSALYTSYIIRPGRRVPKVSQEGLGTGGVMDSRRKRVGTVNEGDSSTG